MLIFSWLNLFIAALMLISSQATGGDIGFAIFGIMFIFISITPATAITFGWWKQ